LVFLYCSGTINRIPDSQTDYSIKKVNLTKIVNKAQKGTFKFVWTIYIFTHNFKLLKMFLAQRYSLLLIKSYFTKYCFMATELST